MPPCMGLAQSKSMQPADTLRLSYAIRGYRIEPPADRRRTRRAQAKLNHGRT
jgi:hypothetical protein